jgi:type IV secretory pathway VirB4 component
MEIIQYPKMTNTSDSNNSHIVVFAKTSFRNELKPFGIRQADRRAHMYILGKTGTGKSTSMETLMQSDLQSGAGFALLDPHGDLVKRVRANIPKNRLDDVIDFDVPDKNQPYGFNPLANVPADKRSLACSGLMQVFNHLWSDSWGP